MKRLYLVAVATVLITAAATGCTPATPVSLTPAPASTMKAPSSVMPTRVDGTVSEMPSPGQKFTLPETKALGAQAPVPTFAGPYASEFESAYRNSSSDLQRTVLKDGKITEMEITALRDDVVKCLTTNGVRDASFEHGQLTTRFPSTMAEADGDSLVGECQDRVFGTVDMLYSSVSRNPANQDEGALVAACLVRSGLADQGYSGDDYNRDSPDKFPFSTEDPRFNQCLLDPSGNGQ